MKSPLLRIKYHPPVHWSGPRLRREVVCLDYEEGDRVAIVGPIGSGKSLFLRGVCQLDREPRTEVWWRGELVADAAIPQYRSQVIYLGQAPALFPGTVRDNLRAVFSLRANGERQYDETSVRRWLDHFGFGQAFLDQAAHTLSGGERQIMALVRALQLNPLILCLDEPTASLDPETAEVLIATLTHYFAGGWFWVTHERTQPQRVAASILRF